MSTETIPAPTAVQTAPATKYVYFFGGGKADGNGKMKDELGGKGAGLAEMTNASLPVPPAPSPAHHTSGGEEDTGVMHLEEAGLQGL